MMQTNIPPINSVYLNLQEEIEESLQAIPLYGDQEVYKAKQAKYQLFLNNLLKECPEVPFKKFLNCAAMMRGRVVIKTKSENFHKFGVLRTDPYLGEQCTWTHLLPKRYSKYNSKLKELLSQRMDILIKRDTLSFCNGTPKSKYQISIITPEKLEELYQTAQKQPRSIEEAAESNIQIDLLNCLLGIREFIKPKMDEDTIRKICFIVGTIKLNIDGNWVVLTRHASWFIPEEAGKVSNLDKEHFHKHAWVTLIHTPRITIDLLLDKVTNLWNEAIQSSTDNATCTKLNEIEYLMYHVMPYCRGSAAITELVLQAFTHYKQQDYKPKCDLEALSQPYIEYYG